MVFRVKKTKNYTVMSNYHLRDARLSLKAKGLLSQMLSLPDNWNYTVKGLAAINKETFTTIRGVIIELEKAGYIVRRQNRKKSGEWQQIEYDIYEIPRSAEEETETEGETEETPETEVTPAPDEVSPKEKESTPPPREPKRTDTTALDVTILNRYRYQLRENVEFEALWSEYGADIDDISTFVELMAEVCAGTEPIRVNGREIHALDARDRFMMLNREHILYVLESLKNTHTEIKNIRAYTLAALYNAPVTIEQYYQSKVRKDFG